MHIYPPPIVYIPLLRTFQSGFCPHVPETPLGQLTNTSLSPNPVVISQALSLTQRITPSFFHLDFRTLPMPGSPPMTLATPPFLGWQLVFATFTCQRALGLTLWPLLFHVCPWAISSPRALDQVYTKMDPIILSPVQTSPLRVHSQT